MTPAAPPGPLAGPPTGEEPPPSLLKMALTTVAGLALVAVGLEYWERHHAWPVADSWYQLSESDGLVEFRCQNFAPVRFSAEPAPGVTRILMMGGSSTFGFPLRPVGGPPLDRPEHGFVGVLQQGFDRAWPDTIELVNLGVNGGSSADAVRLLRRAEGWGVSGVVLYDGHNEFMSVPERFSARLWPLALYRRFSALGSTATQAPGWSGASSYGGPEHAAAVARRFEDNLIHIADTVAGMGVPLVVSTQASNLAGLDPSWSIGPTDVDLPGLSGLDDATLEASFSSHPHVADVAWQAGRRRAARGEPARAAFLAAADHDGMPFRATSPLNQIIRGLGERDGVTVVDAELDLHRQTGTPGNQEFFDNVHPQPETAVVIAESVALGMRSAGLVPSAGLGALRRATHSPQDDVEGQLRTARMWLRWAAMRPHDATHRLTQSTRYAELVLDARPGDADAQALLAAADGLAGVPSPRPLPEDPQVRERLARVHPAVAALVAP
jgi:hypothetical protein